MGNKVVYNACFGGFSISEKAAILGREISGDPLWGGIILAGENYDGRVCDYFYGYPHDVSRHDKVLVEVVERLGSLADGRSSELKIIEIDSDRYYIDDYDGLETVITPDTQFDWVEIK